MRPNRTPCIPSDSIESAHTDPIGMKHAPLVIDTAVGAPPLRRIALSESPVHPDPAAEPEAPATDDAALDDDLASLLEGAFDSANDVLSSVFGSAESDSFAAPEPESPPKGTAPQAATDQNETPVAEPPEPKSEPDAPKPDLTAESQPEPTADDARSESVV
jgi:hypothetical protein